MIYIDIPEFIKEYITKRPESLFLKDIENNRALLSERIDGKSANRGSRRTSLGS